jgi:hypothetical protein
MEQGMAGCALVCASMSMDLVHRIDAVHYGNPRLVDRDQLKRDVNSADV